MKKCSVFEDYPKMNGKQIEPPPPPQKTACHEVANVNPIHSIHLRWDSNQCPYRGYKTENVLDQSECSKYFSLKTTKWET